MDGDSKDIFEKLSSILNNPEMSDNFKKILNNYSSSETNEDESNRKQDENKTDFPNFDIETILKIKSLMDSLNNQENDSRSNLLLSLKPYVADSKKEKIDQYIKFLNLAKIIEVMSPMGGENHE